MIRVVVLDYLTVGLGQAVVAAGQNVVLPVSLASSDGVTNLCFNICWQSNRFTNPALFIAVTGVQSSSLVNQGTNLLVNVSTKPSQPLWGSNVLAQLSFQTISAQASAFVKMKAFGLTGSKPNGTAYVNPIVQAGRVVVVADNPLLEALPSAPGRTMAVYGKTGANYQLQSNPSAVSPGAWRPVFTFTQTNIAQTLSVTPDSPPIFYRLLQR
jgi:hypothetical protein